MKLISQNFEVFLIEINVVEINSDKQNIFEIVSVLKLQKSAMKINIALV